MTYKNRDLRYNNWHREKLPKNCYAMDIDLLEFRAGRGIVAVTELKNANERIKQWQNNILIELGKKLEVPVYLIIHKELTMFKVTNLLTNASKIFDEPEYIEFIKGL